MASYLLSPSRILYFLSIWDEFSRSNSHTPSRSWLKQEAMRSFLFISSFRQHWNWENVWQSSSCWTLARLWDCDYISFRLDALNLNYNESKSLNFIAICDCVASMQCDTKHTYCTTYPLLAKIAFRRRPNVFSRVTIWTLRPRLFLRQRRLVALSCYFFDLAEIWFSSKFMVIEGKKEIWIKCSIIYSPDVAIVC